jgi:hypothetical protein
MNCLGALILSTVLLPGPGSGDGGAGGPFEAVNLIPADVTHYLHARDAASIRAALVRRPVNDVFQRLLKTGEVSQAWRRLALSAGLEDEMLFDLWLGRSFTLVTRREGETSDWALLTEVDTEQARQVLRRLNPRRLAPRFALPISELPEHELLLAADGSTYLIGPKAPGRLFEELLAALAGAAEPVASLLEHPAMEKARGLGGGEVGIFTRHDPPLGGFSVIVADLDGERILLHHAGLFDSPPFQRPVTKMDWDPAPLEAVEDEAMLAFIEPTDIGGGPVEVFIEAVLDVPLLSAEMRRNLDCRRMFVVGEVEGRQEPQKTDLLLPTLSIVMEMKDRQQAESQLDEQAVRFAEAVNRLSEGGAQAAVPRLDSFRPGEARHIDLGPVMERFSERHPILQSVTLDWTVAGGPSGGYAVISTHPDQLQQTVKALENHQEGASRAGTWTSCGTLNGPRIGRHLRSYGDQAPLLAEADEKSIAEFRETLLLLSELAGGIDRCRWQLYRPTEKEMRLEAQITLSRPESAARR